MIALHMLVSDSTPHSNVETIDASKH